jgi:hypothetical protein
MPEPPKKDVARQPDFRPANRPHERRAQPRSQTILNRIEDAAYAVLRRHERKSA